MITPPASHQFMATLRGAGHTYLLGSIVFAAVLIGCTHVHIDKGLGVRVNELMVPLVEAHEFSGAVVLTRRGKVVYQRGFGMANHASGLPFTPHTASDGASLAKTFTAAGVWWLANEGRIDLDAAVTRYLTDFPHAETTVRQLLSHSNGLPADYAYFDQHFTRDEQRTTRAMLKVIALHAPSPSFPPGTRFEYSSLGFDVGALLIEHVSGQRYEDFLNERFFSRLGMRESFVRSVRLSDWKGVRTLGYRWRDAAWFPFDVFDMEAFRGGSNIYFSASDLSRWASAHSAGTALPAPVSAAGQQRTEVAAQRTGLTGLNWYCDEARTRCYYTGDLNAFYSVVYWDRTRDESVVYVSNSTFPPWRRAWLARELVDALAGKPRRESASVIFEHFNREMLSAVVGAYVTNGFGPITVSKGTQGLRTRIADGLEYDLFPVSREVLYAPGLDLWLAFSGGASPSTLHVRSVFVDAVLHRAPNRSAVTLPEQPQRMNGVLR